MLWFERLTGFAEQSPQQVRENLSLTGGILRSNVNGREMAYGQLETPSLADLRAQVAAIGYPAGKISVREVVADVQQLHTYSENAGALFQVASQFNLLEMIGPDFSPENGVGIYENDPTQGPACAIAAGAGTIYRNYFAMVNGKIGQSSLNQIDCLADIGIAMGNTNDRLWEMKNGYALPTKNGLAEVSNRLRACTESELDAIRKLLRIGIQWNTEVTYGDVKHVVSQVYCSALPVAYCNHPANMWAEFAQLVLEASYEALISAAVLNAKRTGNNKVFLTLLGGGAFGNEMAWIVRAIRRAILLHKNAALNLAIVSYGSSNELVQPLVDPKWIANES
jgi:hypothetical protein